MLLVNMVVTLRKMSSASAKHLILKLNKNVTIASITLKFYLKEFISFAYNAMNSKPFEEKVAQFS